MNDNKISELSQEYVLLIGLIDSLDNKALIIKAWSITISMSGIGASFVSHTSLLLLLSSLSALIFWIMESMWKVFQYSHFYRIKEIENYFSDKENDIKIFQISKSWEDDIKKISVKKFSIFFWSNVCLPHILVFLIGLVLFFLNYNHILSV